MAILAILAAAPWGVAAAGPAGDGASAVLPAYFNPGDAAFRAPLMVMRQDPPPPDSRATEANYAYGPITDSFALNVQAQNASTWPGREWPFIWVNRARALPGHVLRGANPIYPAISDGTANIYRTEFTTVARADAVTKAQVLYILGASQSVWQAPLIANGMSVADAIPWIVLDARPSAFFRTRSQDGGSLVVVDKMVIPSTLSTSAYGVGLDYEVNDDRPATQANSFLVNLGATIRARQKKAYLYTNPWESSSTQGNGLTFDHMDDLKANFDYISFFIWGGLNQCDERTSYPYDVNFLKGVSGRLNFNQIIVTIDLLHCTAADAITIYNRQRIDHFAGYNIWVDGAQQGGHTLTGSNLIIYRLLHGG